ncbi:MAG: hypothetical protein E7168_01965 [Firmicutes bacterium]|nr:hypothetical protein [Bacillota bacterium]
MDLISKRITLILDYISQILVYGKDTEGKIVFSKETFEDGESIAVGISVIKNSYFRFHNLGISYSQKDEFYDTLTKEINDKYKEFNIFINKNTILISSDVNHNQISILYQ